MEERQKVLIDIMEKELITKIKTTFEVIRMELEK